MGVRQFDPTACLFPPKYRDNQPAFPTNNGVRTLILKNNILPQFKRKKKKKVPLVLHHVCTVKTEPSFFFFILIVVQLTDYSAVVHLHTVYVEHNVNFPCNSRMGSALCSHSCTVPKLFVTTALLSDCGPTVGFVGPR